MAPEVSQAPMDPVFVFGDPDNLRHISNWPWLDSLEEDVQSKLGGVWLPVRELALHSVLSHPPPNGIHFFQFRIVYSQSSFSRLTKSSSSAYCSQLQEQ